LPLWKELWLLWKSMKQKKHSMFCWLI
jgi:hypothetical protein